MLAPCTVLLVLSLFGTSAVDAFAAHAVGPFIGLPQPPAIGTPPPSSLLPWMTVGLAILIASYDMSRSRLPGPLVRATSTALHPIHSALEAWHSGLVGDYVTWIVVGLALMVGWVAFVSVS